MRILFATAVSLTMLVQPALAKPVNCGTVEQMAEIHHIQATMLAEDALEVGGSKKFFEWTEDERAQYNRLQVKIDEAWSKVEMYANIYSAVCK